MKNIKIGFAFFSKMLKKKFASLSNSTKKRDFNIYVMPETVNDTNERPS